MGVKTKELRQQLDGSLEHQAITMALATLVERIQRLSKEDRDDLYALLKELLRAESTEEMGEIALGMREILDQEPVSVRSLESDMARKPCNGLKKWMGFVGDKLREFRKRAGITQEELAEKSGLPQSHISRLENGEHSPSRETLSRLSKALGIPLSELDPSA